MYKLYVKENTSSKDLLEYVLRGNNVNNSIIYNKYGKPYLKGNELYFNISNKDNITVCIVSDKEVGIDIERIIYKERVINRICTEEEKRIIKTPEDFTKIWVKKESYVKYLGIGLEYGLKNINTIALNNFKLLKIKDYYISICY